ncbi:MAG TPA: response regulator transcription factor [Actinomycetota bacterium]
MRVLVVEDEAVLAAAITRGLRREGLAVDQSQDGADALDKLAVNRYDLVVLDRDLPKVHGDEVCRQLVDPDADGNGRPSMDGVASSAGMEGRRPLILMLTASGTVEDRVDGLNLGADDYLGKPFAFAELVARVHALGRRTGDPRPAVLERHGVRLDPARREATRDGHFLHLTRKEFGVLEVLMAAGGAVVSAEDLLERVWDEHTDPFTNTVRVTLMNLRRKLGRPPLIETVIGSGYRL